MIQITLYEALPGKGENKVMVFLKYIFILDIYTDQTINGKETSIVNAAVRFLPISGGWYFRISSMRALEAIKSSVIRWLLSGRYAISLRDFNMSSFS